MSRATVVCGSARSGGVTERMCLACAEELEAMGWEVSLVRPSELRIAHCTDCGACRHGACTISDDMDSIYSLFSASDLFVMSSPIHFSGPSSLIKTVMDRFQTHWYHPELPHPARAAVLLCGGSQDPRFGHTVSIMRAFSITTGMAWAGEVCFPDTDRNLGEGCEESVREFTRGL